MATTDTSATSRGVGPVTASAVVAASVTTLACWILEANGIEVPGEVQGAITTILVGFAGWIIPTKRGKRSL